MMPSPTYIPVIRTGVDVSFGNLAATGTLTVAGASTLASLGVTGNATVGGTLAVTGTSTYTGNAVFNGGISVTQPASMNDILAAAVTATSVGVTGAAAFDCITTRVTADTQPRLALDGDGSLNWGPGNAVSDTSLSRSGANALTTPGFLAMGSGQSGGNFSVFGTSLILGSAGTGLQIKEGANATSGIATLVAGTVTVATTKVTANSRIQLTSQVDGGTPGFQRVSARVNGTSFTVTSSNAADTSQVAWTLIEPAP